MKHTVKTIGIAALTTLAAGCGGSSGGGGSSDTTVSRSGQAIDGYLLDAQVCVDINFNAKCDDGEPSTTTASDAGDNGQFSLDGIEQTNRNAPTLVRSIADQTVDTDNPEGDPVSESYELKAPAGAEVVTPLTTLVQAEAENVLANSGSDTSVEEAVDAARQDTDDLLGNPDVDLLNEDYVAAQQDEDAGKADAARKVATTARAVNRIISSTRNEVNSRIDDDTRTNLGDKADSAILNTAIDKVRGKVDQVSQQVNTAIDEGGEDTNLDEVADNAANDPANQVAEEELDNVVNEVTQEVSDLEEVEQEVEEDEDEDATGGTGGSGS